MSKLFAFAVVASLFAVSTATAQAAGRRSCCAPAAACCAAAAPATAAVQHADANVAKAPQATRSFSYQPSTDFGSARGMSRQGWTAGTRDATAKVLGNY
jgi:hypothetical protein